MNQSETNTEGESSNANLPKPSPKGIDLSGIPHFNPSLSSRISPMSSMAPPLCIESEPEFEYEFTIHVGGTPLFVTLWDKEDISACQRACACNITAGEIVYNSDTGIGFFHVRGEDWCFKKQPYQRSWGLHNQVGVHPNEVKQHKSSPITADEILNTL